METKKRTKNFVKRYHEDPEFRKKIIENTRQWRLRKRRQYIISLFGSYIDKCQCCGESFRLEKRKSNLEIHHLDYKKESKENMVILCVRCHAYANILRSRFGVIGKSKLLETIKELRTCVYTSQK